MYVLNYKSACCYRTASSSLVAAPCLDRCTASYSTPVIGSRQRQRYTLCRYTIRSATARRSLGADRGSTIRYAGILHGQLPHAGHWEQTKAALYVIQVHYTVSYSTPVTGSRQRQHYASCRYTIRLATARRSLSRQR